MRAGNKSRHYGRGAVIERKEAVRAWALTDARGNISLVYTDKDDADEAAWVSPVEVSVVPVEIRHLGDGE